MKQIYKEKLLTEGAAFGTGLINGIVERKRPGLSLMTTLLCAAGGLIGSMALDGQISDVMEGVSAGAMGSLGYSVPDWVNGTEAAGTSRQIKSLSLRNQINGRTLGTLGGGTGSEVPPQFQKVGLFNN